MEKLKMHITNYPYGDMSALILDVLPNQKEKQKTGTGMRKYEGEGSAIVEVKTEPKELPLCCRKREFKESLAKRTESRVNAEGIGAKGGRKDRRQQCKVGPHETKDGKPTRTFVRQFCAKCNEPCCDAHQIHICLNCIELDP